MTDTLPDLYRKAAELVTEAGKGEGTFRSWNGCFCTMGAVLQSAGLLSDQGESKIELDSPQFQYLMAPIAEQIRSTGRTILHLSGDDEGEMDDFYWIYRWNDREAIDADDVHVLLNEAADAMETEAA